METMERMPSTREAKDRRLKQPELTCMAGGMALGELDQMRRLLALLQERLVRAKGHVRDAQRHAQMIGDYPYTHPDLRDAA